MALSRGKSVGSEDRFVLKWKCVGEGGGILDRCSLQLCSHLLGYMGSSDTFCLLALLLFPVPSSTLLWCTVVEDGWREGPVLLLC